MAKRRGLWPLPGGTDSYVRTLTAMLEFARDARPSEREMIQWIFDHYDVTSPNTSVSYIRIPKEMGYLEQKGQTLVPTADGLEWLEGQTPATLFYRMDETYVLIGDLLALIDMGHNSTQEILELVNAVYRYKWSSKNQIWFRLHWLTCLGYLEQSGRSEWKLTEGGRRLLEAHSEFAERIERAQQQAEDMRQRDARRQPLHHATVEPAEGTQTADVTASLAEWTQHGHEIVAELQESEHDSQSPDRFEAAVTEAFSYLGFATDLRGGAGRTDVYIVADMGSKSYAATCDCKTTSREVISDAQIDWLTLAEHRSRLDAEYTVLVGTEFRGQRVEDRARQHRVALLTTQELIDIVEMHRACPFTLQQLEVVFHPVGRRQSGWLDELSVVNEEALSGFELVAQTVLAIEQVQKQHEQLGDVQTRDLFWTISRLRSEGASMDLPQVETAVALLANPLFGVLLSFEQKCWLLPMTSETVLRRLQVCVAAVERAVDESRG